MDPPIDTVSECWRAESETVIDTTSEPPALYGRQADRIRRREPGDAEVAAAQRRGRDAPTLLSAKLEGDRSGAAGSNVGNGNRNSAAAPPSVKSSRGGKKSSSASSAAMSSSGRSRRSIKSKSAASAKSSAGRSVRSSRSGGKSRKGGGESSVVSQAGSRREPQGSSDAPEGGGAGGNNHLALVPMPRRDIVGVDPPENDSASTSGSSSSQDECTAVLYDPPSAAQRDEEQLAVWEGDEYHEESESERSSCEDEETYRSRLSRIGESGSDEEEEEEEDSDDDDDGEDSYEEEDESYISGDGSATRGSELASAVERALAIREQGEDDGHSGYGDSRALVTRDGGVDSHYGELVPREDGAMGRYLAGAVDNNHAMVPVDSAIYEAYDHTFVTCPERMRFRFLYTFLKKNLDKKVMIFFSTTNSAKYHASLLGRFNIKVSTMHSRQKRDRFIRTFLKFSDQDEGILCATDTAGRDLDIPPSVDWVIQFEPPEDPSEFILRVARISCDSDRVGRSLLFLNSGEQGFLKYYHSASIPVSEFEIPPKLADVQSTVERHVAGSERLGRAARDAYGSYLIAYASHGFRDVYNVHDLDKSNVASAFGLVGLPSNADDDVTEDTETLTSGGESRVGGEPAAYYASSRPSSSSRGGGAGGSSSGGGRQQWEKQERARSKSWMKGEKSWPHSQIKLHPRFKGEKF